MVKHMMTEELEDDAGLEATVAPVDDTEEADTASDDEIVRLTEALNTARDQHLRLAAEFENFRRRMDRQRAEWPQRARAEVVKAMLPMLDDFDRCLVAAAPVEDGEAAFTALREGVDLVLKNFWDRLAGFGLSRIDAQGQPFDEHLHEAIMQMPAPEGVDAGSVLQEVQRGYCMGELVLRHAQVIVAAQKEEVPEPSTASDEAPAKMELQ